MTLCPIGEVIRNTFTRRDGMWAIDEEGIRDRKKRDADQRRSDTRRNQDRSRSRHRPSDKRKGDGKGSDKASDRGKHDFTVVSEFRNGTKLCDAWNRGRCTEPCPDGKKHICNRELRQAGRACGLNHRSISCTNAKRGGK